MKKVFERPELIIVYFEDELATDIVDSGGPYGDNSEYVDPIDDDD